MRALLVDDERLARQELRRLLSSHPDVAIVGEAANADEAVAHLADPSIDLVFLDIKMPGATGFDVLERVERLPLVVFTTAFDEYAVRAFEVNAFDYLLKPIRAERLAAALDKTRKALATRAALETGHDGRQVQTRSLAERIFLRDGDRCWIVQLSDIELFETEGNYTRAYVAGHRPLIRTSLNALEARLSATVFFRASRQHIFNLRFVESIDAEADDTYTVRLRSGSIVPVSRRQSRQLRENLSL
jgi:two-component system LytT family response regulator